MTTPNGHEQPDVGAASEQVTSTVLALDGWGPVVPEPATNGTNGVEADTAVRDEPEVVVEVEPEDDRHRDAWWERLQQSLHGSPSLPSVDSQLLRILASAAAMSIAVFVVISLGRRLPTLDISSSTPLASSAGLRRRLALAIDPSLTPAPPRTGRFSILARLLEF